MHVTMTLRGLGLPAQHRGSMPSLSAQTVFIGFLVCVDRQIPPQNKYFAPSFLYYTLFTTLLKTIMPAFLNCPYIYHFRDRGRDHYFPSFLPPSDLEYATGLPPEAIIGELRNPHAHKPEDFLQNGVFREFLAHVIEKHVPADPAFMAQVRRKQNGFVYIFDGRTPTPQDAVPPEDIIGCFEIENGEILGSKIDWSKKQSRLHQL